MTTTASTTMRPLPQPCGGRPHRRRRRPALPGWSLGLAGLTTALALTACGGGSSTVTTGAPPGQQPPADPPPPGPAAPLLTGQHFSYTLTRSGQASVTETGSQSLDCSTTACQPTNLRRLDSTATRDGFQTRSDSLPDAWRRYGFWGQHGYSALLIRDGTLRVEVDGNTWRDPSSRTTLAWAAGETTGSNPVGNGSATWTGVAEAASTSDFQHLTGTARLRIPDLSQPLMDATITLDDDGNSVPLQWTAVPLANGAFGHGTATQNRIDGRFHGPGHVEAFGVFHTNAYIGAFGAKREQQ